MTVEIAPKLQKMVVVEAPFIEELSGMAMVKILDMKEQTTNVIKLKFIRNKAVLKITNKTHKFVTFGRTEIMGIVDLRSLGFYKIKQEVLQKHLGRHYYFELADDVCDQYNRFVNLMRKEEENSEGKFPWLEDTNEKKAYDGQRNTRQICESGQLMLDQDRENAGKGFTIQIQRYIQLKRQDRTMSKH